MSKTGEQLREHFAEKNGCTSYFEATSSYDLVITEGLMTVSYKVLNGQTDGKGAQLYDLAQDKVGLDEDAFKVICEAIYQAIVAKSIKNGTDVENVFKASFETQLFG